MNTNIKKDCFAVLVVAFALVLGACSSPPPIYITDSYQLSLSSKTGVNRWEKSLNDGLCQVNVGMTMVNAYSESAKAYGDEEKAEGVPYAKLSLLNEKRSKQFIVTASYDADSSLVSLNLVHDNGSKEYLNFAVPLQAPFTFSLQPFPEGDVGIGVVKGLPTPSTGNSKSQSKNKQEQPLSTDRYNAYPGFKAQFVVLETFASNVDIKLLEVQTGCK